MTLIGLGMKCGYIISSHVTEIGLRQLQDVRTKASMTSQSGVLIIKIMGRVTYSYKEDVFTDKLVASASSGCWLRSHLPLHPHIRPPPECFTSLEQVKL